MPKSLTTYRALAARLVTLALCSAACISAPAQVREVTASSYPSKPVRIVVPYPPGGPTDLFARLLADKLTRSFGQTFIVDNKAGGTGLIGTSLTANSPADGYTLLFTSNSGHVMSPLLHNPPPYDPLKQFEPISMVLTYPFYLVVNNDVPARSVAELVSLAAAKPGTINYASVGTGAGNHLVSVMFGNRAGIDTVHVPYKGVAAIQMAVMRGEVHFMFDSIGPTKPLVDAGKMRALAVTGRNRSPIVPDLPTLEESGYPGFDAVIWFGVFAPGGTPRPVVKKLEAAVIDFVRSPEISKRISEYAAIPVGSASEEFAQYIMQEQKMWADLIKSNDIRLN